jgi:hypothetical protein
VNYFCLAVLIFIGAFLRHPLAFFAVGCATFTTLCLNDLFSHAVRHAPQPRTPPLAGADASRAQRARRAHRTQSAPAARRQAAQPDCHVCSLECSRLRLARLTRRTPQQRARWQTVFAQ